MQGGNKFIIMHDATERYMFTHDASGTVTSPGSEKGWAKALPLRNCEANYYNFAIFQIDGYIQRDLTGT